MSSSDKTNNARWPAIAKIACLAVMIGLLTVSPGCKKKTDNISGNWRGTLTVELSHQHEEYQSWDEIIPHEDGPDEVIEHIEHVTWTFTDTIVIEFAFNVETPLYEAQIDGEGTARQEVHFTSPAQCGVTGIGAPDFNVKVFGTVGGDNFTFEIVPNAVPVIAIGTACQNIQVLLPDYAVAALSVLSNIRINVPSQSGITTGGSGAANPGGGFNSMAYIYNLTLNQQ